MATGMKRHRNCPLHPAFGSAKRGSDPVGQAIRNPERARAPALKPLAWITRARNGAMAYLKKTIPEIEDAKIVRSASCRHPVTDLS